MFRIKRVYDEPQARDGYRVLVDRLWPRGLRKDAARLDEWARELAPSDALRRWFAHDPNKWGQFRRRYFRELRQRAGRAGELRRQSRGRTVTLLFAARDDRHNNAVALRDFLRQPGAKEPGRRPPATRRRRNRENPKAE